MLPISIGNVAHRGEWGFLEPGAIFLDATPSGNTAVAKKKPTRPPVYVDLLKDLKSRIHRAQTRAVLAVNAELVRLYWDIGKLLDSRQIEEGYGTAVIPRLAKDLKNEMPDLKGFSERNIGLMISFFRAYSQPELLLQQAVAKPLSEKLLPQPVAKVPQPVAKLKGKEILPQPVAKLKSGSIAQQPVAQLEPDSLLCLIPWGHHALLLAQVKNFDHRLWYMRQTLEQGWSRNVLGLMIRGKAHARQGKAITNFAERLPPEQSDLVVQALKDPYIFDFLTLAEPFRELELETGLLRHLQKFLVELGNGFAFVGRQYHFEIGADDFYVDLLFYHLRLRCFVVIDLKKGEFKPEYAGKMNFYLSVADDKLRHASDAPSIGLILCQDRNKVVAEYALRGMNKPIGVSEYELTRALPKELRSSLPSIEEIEAELAEMPRPKPMRKAGKKSAG